MTTTRIIEIIARIRVPNLEIVIGFIKIIIILLLIIIIIIITGITIGIIAYIRIIVIFGLI